MTIEFPRAWMNEELQTYRTSVVRFLEAKVIPDDADARQRGHVDRDVWHAAGDLSLLCTDIPDRYGGGGGDFRHEAIIHDEMARRCLTGMNTSVHSIVAHYLLRHGSEDQKRRYLPRLASGELVGAIAMTEPDAGSDLQGIRTRAERTGTYYLINGAKTFISNGYLADLVLVVCKTDPAQRGPGISILIVETQACEGYRLGRKLDKIGMKAQDTSELFFDNVRVPAENLLGAEEGRGFRQLMSDLPYERTIISVMAAAAMEGAFEATLAHVKARTAFGKPLIEFQNTRFKLAEIATSIRVARCLVDRCISDLMAGHQDSVSASMAKLWTTETQGRVVDDCLQLFGGYGYMNEYAIARFYADARVSRIYGGTSEIMKEVISRAL